MPDLKIFYIETYDSRYDWDYNVIAETKEQAIERLNAHWASEEIPPKTIHELHGPHPMTYVMQAKGPNL